MPSPWRLWLLLRFMLYLLFAACAFVLPACLVENSKCTDVSQCCPGPPNAVPIKCLSPTSNNKTCTCEPHLCMNWVQRQKHGLVPTEGCNSSHPALNHSDIIHRHCVKGKLEAGGEAVNNCAFSCWSCCRPVAAAWRRLFAHWKHRVRCG